MYSFNKYSENVRIMKKLKFVKLVLSVLVCLGAGFVGSFFTMQNLEPWYAGLNKPAFAPSGSVISVVWIILYVLMGVSLYFIVTKDLSRRDVRIAVGVFAVQLGLNALWSFLFFGLTSALYGLIGIVMLWVGIAITIYKFHKISKKAAYLLIPYIGWVTIALFLNYSIYVLN